MFKMENHGIEEMEIGFPLIPTMTVKFALKWSWSRNVKNSKCSATQIQQIDYGAHTSGYDVK